MSDLLDVGKTEYRLFDEMRRKFIPIRPARFDEGELARANEYFVKSLCPNLQWKSKAEQAGRAYTVKR